MPARNLSTIPNGQNRARRAVLVEGRQPTNVDYKQSTYGLGRSLTSAAPTSTVRQTFILQEIFHMMSPIVGQVTLAIYALLLAVGGVIGYVKAGSRPSLIAGAISALAALLALGLSIGNNRLGVPLGLILSIALFVLFGYRYAAKTRKFMPSGLLAVASLVVLAVMFLVMDWTWAGS
jgi:uncharacterized membrane protein (UPF0136 family)